VLELLVDGSMSKNIHKGFFTTISLFLFYCQVWSLFGKKMFFFGKKTFLNISPQKNTFYLSPQNDQALQSKTQTSLCS